MATRTMTVSADITVKVEVEVPEELKGAEAKSYAVDAADDLLASGVFVKMGGPVIWTDTNFDTEDVEENVDEQSYSEEERQAARDAKLSQFRLDVRKALDGPVDPENLRMILAEEARGYEDEE